MQLERTHLTNKIIIQYILALCILFILSGLNFLISGVTTILFSTIIIRPYCSWLVSRCEECVNVKANAMLYAIISSVSVLLMLTVAAFDNEYFPSQKDTGLILLLALGSAVFVYFFNLVAFGFEVGRFRENRTKKRE